MNKKAIAVTKNSFKLTGRGIVINLQHFQNGLKKGTVLTSQKSGLSWEVIARILFDHAAGNQIVFENEQVEYLLLNFDNSVKRDKSLKDIQMQEFNNVFQYYLKPIKHSEKPLEKEELTITTPTI